MNTKNKKKCKQVKGTGISFLSYIQSELRRGYLLENDEERYTERREKVYTFFTIPREIEKFFAYGFFQCADSFLFVITFLPFRFILALWSYFVRLIRKVFRRGSSVTRLLKPAEIVDILKSLLLFICCYLLSYIDTSVCYHMIKTQSTIKLYLFFNMLEIADRLMSAFGQDTLDALFWTATEPRGRKREHFGVVFHLLVASAYIALHSFIVLLQALTLNVAINSDNKGLLTIVISNNFVELKGAVFKKFDRNNLLQISCSDVRERFHLCVLLFVVVLQTMKEYSWKEERLWILLPDCLLVFGTEILIDWLKHAFITRFNDITIEAYKEYTILLASDLLMCKQKYAYSDHSDLVARRMGFIPLPLGVVIFRILSQSLQFSSFLSYVLLAIGFMCLLTFRVLNGIIILGKACHLMDSVECRSRTASETMDKTTAKSNTSTPVRTTVKTITDPLDVTPKREDNTVAGVVTDSKTTQSTKETGRQSEVLQTNDQQCELAVHTSYPNSVPNQKQQEKGIENLLANVSDSLQECSCIAATQNFSRQSSCDSVNFEVSIENIDSSIGNVDAPPVMECYPPSVIGNCLSTFSTSVVDDDSTRSVSYDTSNSVVSCHECQVVNQDAKSCSCNTELNCQKCEHNDPLINERLYQANVENISDISVEYEEFCNRLGNEYWKEEVQGNLNKEFCSLSQLNTQERPKEGVTDED